ncbi:MAG: cytochrome c [Chloroflexi bacterium]|nr:cytochrome c [Chloroflexota bacterium]
MGRKSVLLISGVVLVIGLIGLLCVVVAFLGGLNLGQQMTARSQALPIMPMMPMGSSTPQPGDFSSNGERIFRTGSNDQGMVIPNSMMSGMGCAMCHGVDGHGGTMMGRTVPNITWMHLADPNLEQETINGRHRNPYSEQAYKVAIVGGHDSAGNALDQMMPRWQMSDQDLNDVIAYLKTLR